jgi:hypothetical protein
MTLSGVLQGESISAVTISRLLGSSSMYDGTVVSQMSLQKIFDPLEIKFEQNKSTENLPPLPNLNLSVILERKRLESLNFLLIYFIL